MDSSLSTIQVDTLVDENDGDLSAGDVSLREAIEAVEAGGTIRFASSLANEDTGAGKGVIALSEGQLIIDKALSIKGLGADKLTVSGNNNSSVFYITDGSTSTDDDKVTLDGLTISDGANNGGGGAIIVGKYENDLELSVANSSITGNNAGIISDYYYYRADIEVKNSVIDNNQGRGVVAGYGSITIADSTISNNAGTGVDSYGIYVGGEVTITNSSITNNGYYGVKVIGAIGAPGKATIVDSIISGNEGNAIRAGGGRFYDNGTIEVINSVIADNEAGLITGDGGLASITIESSTVSGNKGTALNSYSIDINNSSVLNNDGAGVAGAFIEIKSSTIAKNKSGGVLSAPNIYAPYYNGVTINNSTISGNGSRSSLIGGVDIEEGLSTELRITNTTITDNASALVGGLFIGEDSSYTDNPREISNTIIAGNRGGTSDVSAVRVDSLGFNLIGNGTGVTGLADTDVVGSRGNVIDPQLGELQDNGGNTLTQVPLTGSSAVDAGDPTDRTNRFDQRGNGFARRVDGDGDGSDRIDIGAVEASTGSNPNPNPNPNPDFHILNGDNRRNRLFGAGGRDLISGLKGPDTLKGRGNDDILLGGAGKDRLFGDGGDDILNGGLGRDKLSGGGGKDTFVYEGLNEGKDVILDFKVGQDLIDLSGILDGARYNSATPFEDYIRLGQVGRNTRLEVLNANASRGGREVFTELAVIRHVAPADLGESSFVL